MKYIILLLFIIIGHCSWGQDKNLLQHKRHFSQELKQWTNTFNNFNLIHFKAQDTLQFENNFEKDFDHYKEFLSTYKPIVTYSPDSSKFIDIYSYQLNLEKEGNFYYASPDIDQTVFLCIPKAKYWNRIYFGTNSHWLEEVVWTSRTTFILVGITKSAGDKKTPLILFGDTDKQTLVRYLSTNISSSQNERGYSSPKLKKMEIKGL